MSDVISAYLRSIARDMESASCELAKLKAPWPVNACKLRGQASLIREWAEQIEHDGRRCCSDDPDKMDREALGLDESKL